MSKNPGPGKHSGASPPPRGRSAAARLWIIGLALAAVAAAVLVFSATRPKPGTDASPAAASGFLPTKHNPARPSSPAPEGMVWIPGGEFSMGSDAASEVLCGLPGVIRDALPIHRVYLDGFWMDKTDVTNEKFEEFVKAAGLAEGQGRSGDSTQRRRGTRRNADKKHYLRIFASLR